MIEIVSLEPLKIFFSLLSLPRVSLLSLFFNSLYLPPPFPSPPFSSSSLCHFFVQFEERKRIEKSGGTVRYVLASFPGPTWAGNEARYVIHWLHLLKDNSTSGWCDWL